MVGLMVRRRESARARGESRRYGRLITASPDQEEEGGGMKVISTSSFRVVRGSMSVSLRPN